MVRLSDGEVHAGDIARLEVTLRSYKGEARTEILPLRIPDDAGGEEVQIEITGGDYVRPYRPMPDDLDDAAHHARDRAIPRARWSRASTASHEGLSTRHGLLHELPDSVLETLADQSSTQDAVRFKQLARRVSPPRRSSRGSTRSRRRVLPRKTTSIDACASRRHAALGFCSRSRSLHVAVPRDAGGTRTWEVSSHADLDKGETEGAAIEASGRVTVGFLPARGELPGTTAFTCLPTKHGALDRHRRRGDDPAHRRRASASAAARTTRDGKGKKGKKAKARRRRAI